MVTLDWASIGVCWTLTTVTIVALYGLLKGIGYLRRRRRPFRERRGVAEEKKSTRNDQSIPLMELKCLSSSNGCRSISASASASASSRTTSYQNDRRKQDEVSRWCSDHGLPESLVYTLREQGFETKASLDALRPDDLRGQDGNQPLLLLSSKASVVQLREVLMKIHGISPRGDSVSNNNSKRSNFSDSSEKRKVSLPQQGSVDSAMSSERSPTTNSDIFFVAPLRGSDEIDGVSHPAEYSRGKSRSSSAKTSVSAQCFHGLLSDEGIWELTKMIGHEWRHLATLLNTSTKTQEQLMETHRHNVQAVIHDMLTRWRDNCGESKDQTKGQLYKALLEVGRKDIANKLMHEQINGSNQKVNSQFSII